MKKALLTTFASIGLCYASIAQNVPSYVSSNGLQAWWSFDGNANDVSGNGHNGTINGATLTSDRNGAPNAAYSFNGTNNSISIPDHDSLSFSNNVFTFSFWLNWNPNTAQELAIMGKRGSQTSGFEFYLDKIASTSNNPDCIMAHTWNLSGANVYGIPPTLTSTTAGGAWNHFVIAADGAKLRFYKNGVNVDSSYTPIISMGNSSGNLTIGSGGGWGSTKWMDGMIDDIGIWRRVLTPNEIGSLYNSLSVSTIEIAPSMVMSAYPNPTKNQITLVSDTKLVGTNYTLYDYVGKSVLSGQISSENITIDISSVTNGIYFLSAGELSKKSIKVIKE